MRLILTVEDDIAEVYKSEATARKIPIEQLIEERIAHAGELDPRERYLIVAGNNRKRLEATLGGLPVLSVEELLQKTARLARIKFGDHTILLSAGQMEELAWRANKLGKSVEDMVQIAYERFAQDFFSLVP